MHQVDQISVMRECDLAICHFNDVYHVSPVTTDPVGGAARFLTLLKEARGREGSEVYDKTLTLFSGDAFHPSLEAAASKGKHMVPVLNALGIDVACIGNHDLDFGEAQLLKLIQGTTFPWMISNVYDSATGYRLAHGREYVIIDRIPGLRIGIVGLVEKEWLATLRVLPSTIEYRDFVKVGKTLIKKLKEEDGCNFLIALTHMRLPNDRIVAKEMPEFDLVLGGHDHFYKVVNTQGNQHIVKSGTDFRDLSHIKVWFKAGEGEKDQLRQVEKMEITRHQAWKKVKPDPELDACIEGMVAGLIDNKVKKIVARTVEPLDARSEIVRTGESNIGNLAADIIRHAYDTDIGFVAGGTIRSDMIISKEVSVRDILELFPFEDPIVVIELTGAQVWEALESGLSMLPKQEGRFPHISGLYVEYDSSHEPMNRVLSVKVQSSGKPIDKDAKYSVATREYMAQGRDGYQVFTQGRYLIDDENGCLLSSLFRRYLLGLKYVEAFKSKYMDENGTDVSSSDKPASGWERLRQMRPRNLSARLKEVNATAESPKDASAEPCHQALDMYRAASCAASMLPDLCKSTNSDEKCKENKQLCQKENGLSAIRRQTMCQSLIKLREERSKGGKRPESAPESDSTEQKSQLLSHIVPTIHAKVDGRLIDRSPIPVEG